MLDKHLIVKTEPKANAENVVLWKDYRVTVLQDRLFRLEKNVDKKFRDEATQRVWFRNLPVLNFKTREKRDSLTIETERAKLVLKEKREDCYILINGKKTEISNEGNLKGTYRTLDECDGKADERNGNKEIRLGDGVCSKTGVAVFNDQSSLTLNDCGEITAKKGEGSDEYIFAYGSDYRSAVRALFSITGKTPLVPRFALGNWWSRYHEYSQDEYMRIITRFEENEVPLTVATIDMDWHWSNRVDEKKKITSSGRNSSEYIGGNGSNDFFIGWTGYSWNTDLFYDYKKLLRDLHIKNLKVTLNLHPADGVRFWEDKYNEMAKANGVDPESGKRVPFNIADVDFINSYFKILHKPYENDGVDFWWIDWQQGERSGTEGLDPLWSLNHYHYLDNASNHSSPLILSRYAGIGSHRYPLGFSGDTAMTWNTLKYLPYFTATASNVGYAWWSHDIGGHHRGEKDNELFVRHVQFGVFSPINRLHCTCWETMSKEPWYYKNGSGLIAEEWLNFRHKLIPFLYSASYRVNSEGLPLVQPLYYEWKNKEAYRFENEYIFGEELIVVSATEKIKKDGYARFKTWLPEGEWTDIFTGDKYTSPTGGKIKTLLRPLDSIPVLIKSGGILPLSADKGNSVNNPEKLDLWVYKGCGEYNLYEDDSVNGGKEGVFTKISSVLSAERGEQTVKIFAEGNASVIPENRILRVMFKDIEKGAVTVYKDGKELKTEKTYADCPAIIFPFDPRSEYTVKISFFSETRLEYLKRRALKVLLESEGNSLMKKQAFDGINQAVSVEQYALQTESDLLPKIIKLRLKETL